MGEIAGHLAGHLERLRQRVGGQGTVDGPAPRMLHVRLVVQLDQSIVDLDKHLPLGDTTEETLAHCQALVVTPGLELAAQLVRAHFEALRYVLGLDASEEG